MFNSHDDIHYRHNVRSIHHSVTVHSFDGLTKCFECKYTEKYVKFQTFDEENEEKKANKLIAICHLSDFWGKGNYFVIVLADGSSDGWQFGFTSLRVGLNRCRGGRNMPEISGKPYPGGNFMP